MSESAPTDDRVVLHWPAMGVENGEFVALTDDEGESPDSLVVGVLFAAGLLAQFVRVALVVGVGVLGAGLLAGTPTGAMLGGSVETLLLVLMTVAVAVEAVGDRVLIGPFRLASSLLALGVTLPVGIAVAAYRATDSSVQLGGLLTVVRGLPAQVLVTEVVRRSRPGGQRR